MMWQMAIWMWWSRSCLVCASRSFLTIAIARAAAGCAWGLRGALESVLTVVQDCASGPDVRATIRPWARARRPLGAGRGSQRTSRVVYVGVRERPVARRVRGPVAWGAGARGGHAI